MTPAASPAPTAPAKGGRSAVQGTAPAGQGGRPAPGERPFHRALILLHSVLVMVWAALITPPCVLVYVALGALNLRARPERAIEWLWGGSIAAAAGVRLKVTGRERLARGASFVIMPNHRSWIDVPLLFRILAHRDTRWVGKKEIVSWPFFGWAFALSRHVVIDRGNRDAAVRAIRKAAGMTGDGVSVMIFPEGTRSTGRTLLPLKKGGFHLALETGLPILPVAVSGTERVLPKHGWTVRPGAVNVVFCEPVAPRGGAEALLELVAEVRQRLGAALERVEGPSFPAEEVA
ncbi:MAG: 1-acyl-sn-glycerol-3-phosphate acyltransferase [Gemmatimonadetes bacterium]|nr:1-acyl-sn-glycerol-3-phosphate acyltransferase [Gemmatimonadota bacterium]